MTPRRQLDELLDHFSRACGTSLKLENGVCALYSEDQREAAILEFPHDSASLFIHAAISAQGHASETSSDVLMRMNFEANALRGCWLAIDPHDTLRLCTQRDPLTLTPQQFTSLLTGFIALADDVRQTLSTHARG